MPQKCGIGPIPQTIDTKQLLLRFEAPHVINECLCLLASQSLRLVSRHVRRLLGLFPFQDDLNKLLVFIVSIKLLLSLLAMTHYAFAILVIGGRVGVLDVGLSGTGNKKDQRQHINSRDSSSYSFQMYVLHDFFNPSVNKRLAL